MAASGGSDGVEVALRVTAVVLTLTSALLMGFNKQTKTVSIAIFRDLIIPVPHVTAKFSYMSAFVYFVVANSIASAIATFSLLLVTLASRQRRLAHGTLVKAMGDLIAVALLSSGYGAVGAVGIIGYKGNSHVMWMKVCNQFGRFCGEAVASGVISLLASLVFLLLILLAFRNLNKKLQV